MSKFIIKSKEYDLKYTFNSFKYMTELDFALLEAAEDRPFLIAPFLDTLLLGALNHNPRVKISEIDVVEQLEEFVADENNHITELMTELMELLQESNFFKSLQRK